jgi:hypothetical protein
MYIVHPTSPLLYIKQRLSSIFSSLTTDNFEKVGFCVREFAPKDKESYCTAKTKCRKFETNIPRKGISGPQSQIPYSCVCERIIYSHDGSAFSAGGNMWTDPGNI